MSPYSEHPVFEKPSDPNIRIWRYMDLVKYVSLLEKQALYFVRADILADEFDPFEGQFPNDIVVKILEKANTDSEKEHVLRLLKNIEFQKMLFINCWHINELESFHMWKIYAKRNYGIAIQSTFDRLCRSFDVYKKNDVFIGKVKYDNKHVIFGNSFYPYMHKRPFFESDKELRAIILNIWKNYKERLYDDSYLNKKGENIPVNLDVLIENIVLAPKTPDYVQDLIISLSTKYGMKNPIMKSVLDETPLIK